jgi:MFS family permease
VVTAAALGVAMWGPSLVVFAAAMFVTGMGTAVWQLARQAYVTAVIPFRLRARAMSLLGGVYRIGLFVGPFIGSGVVHFFGTPAAYAVHIVAAAAAVVVLYVYPDLTEVHEQRATPTARARDVVVQQASVLRTLGVGVLLISAVRASRQVVLPLWGEHLGLSPALVALIFGISGAFDMLVFYPSGQVMDRFGRVWAAAPSMIVLALGHLLLPLTSGPVSLIAVGVVLGVGNGLGSGLVMTLGADLAPRDQRPVFLGVWRFCADVGNGAGPVALSGLTALASLGVAILAMGGIGLVGAAMLTFWIPRRGRPIG